MTKYIVALLLIIGLVSTGFAQSEVHADGHIVADGGRLFKTYSAFTATSDDTTGYVTINIPGFVADPLLCPLVRLVGIATDSVAADVYVLGRNRNLTAFTASYADSIVGTSNTSNTTVITLRAHGTDRLAGCTQFKVGTVFRATGQGTTAGRSLKWYIMYRLP
jgi:hypothetical protein